MDDMPSLTAAASGDTAPLLLFKRNEGVLTLALNRPAKLNAINPPLAQALLAALLAADADPGVRAVLLCGNGRAFCAGRDTSAAPTDADLDGVQNVAAALVNCRKPIVAAVHGWVVGAGVEWMLAADVVVAAAGARLRLPEASLGVFVTGGISATLPAIAGLARAKAMMLLGDPFSAAQAQEWGLVWDVVDDDALPAHALQVAQKLAALSPAVAMRFKRVLNAVALPQFEDAVEIECRMMRELSAPPHPPSA